MYEKAIIWAAYYHNKQVDKQGKPYIFHVLSVANNFEEESVAFVVACLHDVVEDTECTLDLIEKNFGYAIAEQVSVLTHKKGEPYLEYIVKILPHDIARRVKIADIKHNKSRINELDDPDTKARLYKKYSNALLILEKVDVD